MHQKVKTMLAIFAFVLLLGAAVFSYNILRKNVAPSNSIKQATAEETVSGGTSSPEKAKTKAPDFTVLDPQGNSVKLSALIGKPIVLNFWASWCPPCKKEMPDFNALYEELGEEITFAMVDMVDGQRETIEKGKKHIADQAFTFPVYYDTEQEAAINYGVSSFPTTYFIDKEGYLVAGAEGLIDAETIRMGINMISGGEK